MWELDFIVMFRVLERFNSNTKELTVYSQFQDEIIFNEKVDSFESGQDILKAIRKAERLSVKYTSFQFRQHAEMFNIEVKT